MLEEVRKSTRALGGRIPPAAAGRVAVGLIYLRIRARDEPDAEWGARGPSWGWLVARAQRTPRDLGAHVQSCLRQWLPGGDDSGGPDAGPEFVPHLPRTADDILQRLITAVHRTDRLVDLLEQCLRELSEEQADRGQYFTQRDIARLMVAAADPQDGHRVLDPVCGSAGLLIDAARHVRERTGLHPGLSLTGQDLRADNLQIARMHLAAHGVEASIRPPMDSLARPADGPYDIVLANPPFNMSPWAPATSPGDDPRWPGGEAPPQDNANFAWILHIAHALGPRGRAAILMADGAASGVRHPEQRMRRRLVEEDVVECVVALPPGLFTHTRGTCCLWVLNRDKSPSGRGGADRRRTILLIDARSAYETVAGTRQRRLAAEGVSTILSTLDAWRGSSRERTPYQDEPGWCRSVPAKEIAANRYDLLPVHYSGGAETAEHRRIEELMDDLRRGFAESRRLEDELLRALEEL